jgi:hypothetical protein
VCERERERERGREKIIKIGEICHSEKNCKSISSSEIVVDKAMLTGLSVCGKRQLVHAGSSVL